MEVDYPIEHVPATPEYVLHSLNEYQSPLLTGGTLTFDSTISEWDDLCIFDDWRSIAGMLNALWAIDVPLRQWRAVLIPERQRTLRDVCELIARHAKRPMVRPASIMGAQCLSAGAFLTIRSMLHDAGAAVEHIAPSTALAAYTRRYYHVFAGPISRLAPGALQRVEPALTPTGKWMVASFVTVCFIAIASRFEAMMPLVAMAFLTLALFLLCAVASQLAIWLVPSAFPFRFGEITTFGDLAKAVAEKLSEVPAKS